MTEHGIGSNLRRMRENSGLTQRELANKAGVSPRTIEDLEQDPTRGARLATLRKIAIALDTTTSALLSTRQDAPEGDNAPRVVELLGLLDVLQRTPYIPGMAITHDDDAPSVASMRAELREVMLAHRADAYDLLLQRLPGIITAGRLLVSTSGGCTASALLSGVLRFTGMTLRQLGREDMAAIALGEAVEVATRANAWPSGAYAVSRLADVMICQGRLGAATDMCEAMANHLRSVAGSDPTVQTYRDLAAPRATVLTTAAAAASRDGRDATGFLDEAEHAAADLDALDESRVRVDAMRAEVAMVCDRPDDVLEHARRVPWTTRTWQHPNMVRRSQLDVAAAHLRLGDLDKAARTIVRVGESAPAWLKRQPLGRQIVEESREEYRRRLPSDLVTAADMVGLPR